MRYALLDHTLSDCLLLADFLAVGGFDDLEFAAVFGEGVGVDGSLDGLVLVLASMVNLW